VIAFTDPVVVGALCQGVLFVIRANSTSIRAIQRAQSQLGTAHVPIVGMVVNGLRSAPGYGYSYYYKAYSHYSDNGQKPSKRRRGARFSRGRASIASKMRYASGIPRQRRQ